MTNPFKKGTKNYLFYQIAQPDENGISRWVLKSEFVGEYADLMFQNGASWCRAESSLAKKYIIEFDKSLTSGNSVDAIRLNGFNNTFRRIKIDPYLSLSIQNTYPTCAHKFM